MPEEKSGKSIQTMKRLTVLTKQQLSLSRRILVVGDLHGDAKALAKLLAHFDPHTDMIVFLGDYADRGERGVEVVERVHHLTIAHPERVIALQGNHENYSPEGEPLFSPCHLRDEATEKWGSWQLFFDAVYRPFLNRLTLAAIIPGELLFVHGGISSKICGLDSLEHPSSELIKDLLNSDCTTRFETEEHNSMRGLGVRFGAEVSKSVCRMLNVKRIIRGHQHDWGRLRPGVLHGGRVMTVVTGRVCTPQQYVIVLDPLDPGRAHYMILSSGKMYPIDYAQLERDSLRSQFPAVRVNRLTQEVREAIDALKARLQRGPALPRIAARTDGLRIPPADKECRYIRFSVAEILRGSSERRGDPRVLLVEIHDRTWQVRDLYYSDRSLAAGTLRRIT